MLVQLERECLEAYKRRVDQASHNRNLLRQAVAECRAELAVICSAMGERMTPIKKVSLSKQILVVLIQRCSSFVTCILFYDSSLCKVLGA